MHQLGAWGEIQALVRKINSIEIAHLAGVSQPTVSRALRGSPLVSSKTRERIVSIARENHYKVDASARNLRTNHNNTIAILIHEDSQIAEWIINPFFLSMIGGVTKAAAARNYDVLLSFQQLTEDWIADYENANKAEGVILLGYGTYTDHVQKLQHLEGAHAVTWGPVLSEQPGHFIGCDNRHGGYIATKHLIDLGHRAIAFIGATSEDFPEFSSRYDGFLRAHRLAGTVPCRSRQVFTTWSQKGGYEAAAKLLDEGVEFSAVFCACDHLAIGAMRCLRERGLKVPDRVSVVGFDDIPLVGDLSPALTTVRQDPLLAGELLVTSLLRLINGQAIKSRLIEPVLVPRESSASPL